MPGGSDDATWAQEILVCLPCWSGMCKFVGHKFLDDFIYSDGNIELEVDVKKCWVCKEPIGRVEFGPGGTWVAV